MWMSNSKESNQSISRRDFLKIAGFGAAGAVVSGMMGENPTASWAQASSTSAENGTVPPDVEKSPDLGRFNTVVSATDQEGNPQDGVVVAFVHSAENEDVLSPDYNFKTGGRSIRPIMENEASQGISNPAQFPAIGQHGIIIGQRAEEFFQSIIDEARAEGRESDAIYLETHYPPIQPLENATIFFNNVRSGEGENPLEITAKFNVDENGRWTAITGYRYPDYRFQDPESLQEIGVRYGLLEPAQDTTAPSPLTDGITIKFTAGEQPSLQLNTKDENIIVGAPPAAEASRNSTNVTQDEIPSDLNTLEIVTVDELMVLRQEYFENQLSEEQLLKEQQPAATATSAQEAPTQLPEGSRKLATIIKGTELVTTDGRYMVTFNLGTNAVDTLTAELTDILPTDIVKLKIVGGQIVVENLSGTDHKPRIEVVGEGPELPPIPPEGPPTDPTEPPVSQPKPFKVRAPLITRS